jgi:hypothetical protein
MGEILGMVSDTGQLQSTDLVSFLDNDISYWADHNAHIFVILCETVA